MGVVKREDVTSGLLSTNSNCCQPSRENVSFILRGAISRANPVLFSLKPSVTSLYSTATYLCQSRQEHFKTHLSQALQALLLCAISLGIGKAVSVLILGSTMVRSSFVCITAPEADDNLNMPWIPMLDNLPLRRDSLPDVRISRWRTPSRSSVVSRVQREYSKESAGTSCYTSTRFAQIIVLLETDYNLFISPRDAKKYLEKYNRRVDIAIDAFYNDPTAARPLHSSGPSTSKLNQLFDTYKGTPATTTIVICPSPLISLFC